MTDRLPDFRAVLRQRRAALGLKTPSAEILPRKVEQSPFTVEALATMQKIRTISTFLRENHSKYMLDDELHGMSESERDEVDAETQRFLKVFGERVDALKKQVSSSVSSGHGLFGGSPAPASQLTRHQQAVHQLLYESLQQVAAKFDEYKGHRLKRATEQRDRKVGAASALAARESGAAGRSATAGSSERASGVSASWRRFTGAGAAGAAGAAGGDEDWTGWEDDEVIAEEEIGIDEGARAQLVLENEALQKELECVVEQAREAEQSVLHLSTLSHIFSTKVDEQSHEIARLHESAEQTSENLTKGNNYLDSAAKHSRDFRLYALVFLLSASFSLLFLDWFYD